MTQKVFQHQALFNTRASSINISTCLYSQVNFVTSRLIGRALANVNVVKQKLKKVFRRRAIKLARLLSLSCSLINLSPIHDKALLMQKRNRIHLAAGDLCQYLGEKCFVPTRTGSIARWRQVLILQLQ